AWIVGGPNAVIEILSPQDESRDKFPFYLSIGVDEVILVDRDTLEIELYRAGATRGQNRGFKPVAAKQGWHRSKVLDTELRRAPGRKLLVRRTSDPSLEMLLGD